MVHVLRAVLVAVMLGVTWIFAIPIVVSRDYQVQIVFGWLFAFFTSAQVSCSSFRDPGQRWVMLETKTGKFSGTALALIPKFCQDETKATLGFENVGKRFLSMTTANFLPQSKSPFLRPCNSRSIPHSKCPRPLALNLQEWKRVSA